jgi:hypothetical protein
MNIKFNESASNGNINLLHYMVSTGIPQVQKDTRLQRQLKEIIIFYAKRNLKAP